MSNSRLNFSHDFTIGFEVYLGTNDGGADGLAFVLHNDPRGEDATGGGGGNLGARGIANGLGIEFDTWNNGAIFGDIAADHTNVFDTDTALQAGLTQASSLGNIEDGQWHDVQVVWDAETQTLSYTFDGRAVGTISQDLATAYFGGSEFAHFGFTAGTGGASNLQQVRITSVDALFEGEEHSHEPPEEPPPDHDECGCGFDRDEVLDNATMSGSSNYSLATGIFTLTPDAPGQVGGVMSNARLDLSHDFSIGFEVYLGTKEVGADGLAFVLHNDPRGEDATGGGGGNVGARGIMNGLGIEFDTWDNGAEFGDIAADHTNLFDTDTPLQNRVTQATSLGNIEDGQWHDVQVVWDAETQTLSYTFDGRAMSTITQDLATAYFGGSEFAHFGLTAGTGGASNMQQVRFTTVDVLFEGDEHDHTVGHHHAAGNEMHI